MYVSEKIFSQEKVYIAKSIVIRSDYSGHYWISGIDGIESVEVYLVSLFI